jgi:hypothetical protein
MMSGILSTPWVAVKKPAGVNAGGVNQGEDSGEDYDVIPGHLLSFQMSG